MFHRKLEKDLNKWRHLEDRKPLIIRGARQVGKTSLVHLFGENFEQYIYLNLEKPQDRYFFETHQDSTKLVQALFLSKGLESKSKETLIFIDEIQALPSAIAQLRYFYEDYPELYVIAAGSLLESVFDLSISFPVGRVQYLPLRPLSFEEFLVVTGEQQALQLIQEIPFPVYAQRHLLELFHIYTIIGGMPEIVAKYATTKDISSLQETYDSILVPYLDDVGVYATDITQATLIRQLLNTSFKETGKRITFQGFGNTNYKSREVATGLRLLEKTFLIQLIYPSTGIQLPIHENTKKAPRLQLLDTGLVNYFSRIQDKLLAFKDLNDAYRGTITEHIVFQELLANQKSVMQKLHFWVRDKKTSTAEVDVLYPYKAYVIPIEIKSGAAGRLRSLHQFIEASPLKLGIRLYASTFTVEKHNTISGIPFTLVNIPYFLVAQIDYYLDYIFVNYKIEKS